MLQEMECKTVSDQKMQGQDIRSFLMDNIKGSWLIIAPTASRALKSAYFHPFLTEEVSEQMESFAGFPRYYFTLDRREGMFQVLNSGSIPLLTPGTLRRAGGGGGLS